MQIKEQRDAIVQKLVGRGGVKHAVLAVERGDGSCGWGGAAGAARADGTPMRIDTPFFIASIDKLLIASVVLKLGERGRIALDERLLAYLPAGRFGGLHRVRGVDCTGAITVRHLLGHSSGLADWLEDRPQGGRSLVERVLREGDLDLGLDAMAELLRERLGGHFPPQPLSGRPRVRYSDTNFMLLIALVEALERQPLHEVYERHLFRPLGLRHTWLPGHSRPDPATPEPAALWAGERPLEIPRLIRSLRGVYSTAGELLAFLRALVKGRIFEDPRTLPLMQSGWHRFGLALDAAALRAPQWPIEYALGMMRFRPPRWLAGWRPVPALIGHTGSTGSWLFYCPERDLLFAGTVDEGSAGALPFRLAPRVLRAA